MLATLLAWAIGVTAFNGVNFPILSPAAALAWLLGHRSFLADSALTPSEGVTRHAELVSYVQQCRGVRA